MSTTRHPVVDLVEISKADPTKSKIINGQDFRADYPSFKTTQFPSHGAVLAASIPQDNVLAVACPACRGQHRKHTCGKEKGGPPQEEEKKEEDPGEPIPEIEPEQPQPAQELRHEPEEQEQVAPAIPEPPVGDFPHGIRRIHAKLQERVELHSCT